MLLHSAPGTDSHCTQPGSKFSTMDRDMDVTIALWTEACGSDFQHHGQRHSTGCTLQGFWAMDRGTHWRESQSIWGLGITDGRIAFQKKLNINNCTIWFEIGEHFWFGTASSTSGSVPVTQQCFPMFRNDLIWKGISTFCKSSLLVAYCCCHSIGSLWAAVKTFHRNSQVGIVTREREGNHRGAIPYIIIVAAPTKHNYNDLCPPISPLY